VPVAILSKFGVLELENVFRPCRVTVSTFALWLPRLSIIRLLVAAKIIVVATGTNLVPNERLPALVTESERICCAG